MGVQQCKCLAVRAYLLILLCVFLCLGGGGEGKKGETAGALYVGTNGHVRVSAYVRACVCLWIADGRGKKAVVSGGVCISTCARVSTCMCSAYVFCVYVVAIK